MLKHSFVHLPGIGEKTEQRLWDLGIHTWDDLENSSSDVFGAKKTMQVLEAIEASRSALDGSEWRFFQERLTGAHMWRLAPHCLDAVAYLDIETTGLGFPPASQSTTIAVSFQNEIFVEYDPDKKRQLLERVTEEALLLVTFNGICFDVPFLRREFLMDLAMPHLDLRIWLRRQGFKGGLKKIQAAFSEVPARSSMDIDGFDAVRLWRMHERGLSGALETLMTYNAEDAAVLEPLMYLSLQRETDARTHLPLKSYEIPKMPEIATQIHPYVYDLLRGHEEWQLPQDW